MEVNLPSTLRRETSAAVAGLVSDAMRLALELQASAPAVPAVAPSAVSRGGNAPLSPASAARSIAGGGTGVTFPSAVSAFRLPHSIVCPLECKQVAQRSAVARSQTPQRHCPCAWNRCDSFFSHPIHAFRSRFGHRIPSHNPPFVSYSQLNARALLQLSAAFDAAGAAIQLLIETNSHPRFLAFADPALLQRLRAARAEAVRVCERVQRLRCLLLLLL